MDFSKHIKKADEAFGRRNYDFAVELYRQLLDLDPDLGEARAGLRKSLKKRHEQKKGGKLFGKVAGAAPLARAKTMRKMGKHEACARALEGYLDKNPLDEEANLMLGMSLEDAGHFKSARAVYEFVADIAPKNPNGLKRAGAMMQRTGEPARALEYYERALQADPRDQEALKARKNLAAETALSQTNLDSVQHSRESIKDKDQAAKLERSKRIHRTEDELRQDLERLQDRFAENPSDVEVMREMAEVNERLRDHEGALDLVERALQYKKDDFDLRAKAGDLRSKVLKRQISRADKDGDEEAAGRLERELQEHEVADHAARVDLRPGDAGLRLQYAHRLMRAEEFDQALGQLQKIHGDPRVGNEALFLLARCFHRKGIFDLARKEYERALAAQPQVNDRAKEVLYHLGSIAESQGNSEEARSWYIRIYEVDIGYRDVASKMETLN
ncbi:MAG: tetratricopeptide repeat protein [Planctomycetota bacterium]